MRLSKRFNKRFNKRFHNGFTRTSSPLCSPFWLFLLSWLALSQQAPPVLNAPSIRCLKHLHLVGCCCILGDVVPLAAILWCGSQTFTRTPHPSASWPTVMPHIPLPGPDALGRINQVQKASQWDRTSAFPLRPPGLCTTQTLNGW